MISTLRIGFSRIGFKASTENKVLSSLLQQGHPKAFATQAGDPMSPLSYVQIEKNHLKVKAQNFGPVPLSESSTKTGPFSVSMTEYEKRLGQTFGGLTYSELPIAIIQARWNNTHININSCDHTTKYCYTNSKKVGFLHAKKKTELAGEMTGRGAATSALEEGCPPYVRAVIKGIGPGRKSAVRGLVLGGLNVVSITDRTPITVEGLSQRPRKIRRI